MAEEFSKNILQRTPSGLIVAILAIFSLYSQSILINQFAISVLVILGMIEIIRLIQNKFIVAIASIVMFIVISLITIDLIKFGNGRILWFAFFTRYMSCMVPQRVQ